MANLPEDDSFPAGVYQLEQTDPALGGAPNEATGGGILNIPLMHLAKRTRWLKTRVDTLVTQVVAASTAVAGIVRLTDSVTSSSVTTAATANAAKAAFDNAELRAHKTTTISTAGLAVGGGDLSSNRTISVLDATQEQAEVGSLLTCAMSPLRVTQAIRFRMAERGLPSAVLADDFNNVADGGISAGGAAPLNAPWTYPVVITAKRAAQRMAQIALPSNNSNPRLAARSQSSTGAWGAWLEAWLGEAVAQSLATNGYQRLPSGILIQWGVTPNVDAAGIATFTFPIAFTVAPWVILPGERTLSTAPVASICNIGVSYDLTTTTQSQLRMVRSDGSVQPGDSAFYLAIGR